MNLQRRVESILLWLGRQSDARDFNRSVVFDQKYVVLRSTETQISGQLEI